MKTIGQVQSCQINFIAYHPRVCLECRWAPPLHRQESVAPIHGRHCSAWPRGAQMLLAAALAAAGVAGQFLPAAAVPHRPAAGMVGVLAAVAAAAAYLLPPHDHAQASLDGLVQVNGSWGQGKVPGAHEHPSMPLSLSLFLLLPCLPLPARRKRVKHSLKRQQVSTSLFLTL